MPKKVAEKKDLPVVPAKEVSMALDKVEISSDDCLMQDETKPGDGEFFLPKKRASEAPAEGEDISKRQKVE